MDNDKRLLESLLQKLLSLNVGENVNGNFEFCRFFYFGEKLVRRFDTELFGVLKIELIQREKNFIQHDISLVGGDERSLITSLTTDWKIAGGPEELEFLSQRYHLRFPLYDANSRSEARLYLPGRLSLV